MFVEEAKALLVVIDDETCPPIPPKPIGFPVTPAVFPIILAAWFSLEAAMLLCHNQSVMK